MGDRRKQTGQLMVRGSIYTLRGKCGKENCRCRRGELHETPALSYSLKGKTHIIYLRPEEVPRVRKAIERYKEAREELEAEAMRGIETLRRETEARRAERGGRK